jgi:tetratricopeptide (TPR) repeat protein
MFIQQDRMDEAAGCLRQAVQLKPESASDYRQLGMVLDRLGDRPGARAAFETVLRLRPGDATGRLLLGRLLLDQGQTEEAAAHLEQACRLDAKLAGAYYALSQARSRLGDAMGALAAQKTYQELRDQEKAGLDAQNASLDSEKGLRILAAGFHLELAGVLLRNQQAAAAETHLLQAVRIAPQEPRGREMLSTLYLQAGRLAEARRVCEELVREWPDRAIYRANLGTLLLQIKEPAAALEELKRALTLDAKQPVALANLARFHLNTRQELPEALTLCRRLVEVDPSAAHYDLLGWALYANGQVAEARTAAGKAVEKDPANPLYQERHRRLTQLP